MQTYYLNVQDSNVLRIYICMFIYQIYPPRFYDKLTAILIGSMTTVPETAAIKDSFQNIEEDLRMKA